MKQLFLEDYAGMTNKDVRELIIRDYELTNELDVFNVIIAYESVGNYGCDSSAFLLLKHKETGELYENHASHCSYMGFEGQFEPEKTTLEHLKSNNFYFYVGGYDDHADSNKEQVKEFISKMRKSKKVSV